MLFTTLLVPVTTYDIEISLGFVSAVRPGEYIFWVLMNIPF